MEFRQINPTTEDCEELGLESSELGDNSIFSLTGFVSSCAHKTGRSTNDRQYVFINKRPCDMPKLTRLVNEVYHVFNRNQYPFLVLNNDLQKGKSKLVEQACQQIVRMLLIDQVPESWHLLNLLNDRTVSLLKSFVKKTSTQMIAILILIYYNDVSMLVIK